jgi:hypothetical protein
MVEKTRDAATLDVVGRRIDAYTNAHVEYLEDLYQCGTLGSGEDESLTAFAGFLTAVLERFDDLVSPAPQRPTSRKRVPAPRSMLLLTDFYEELDQVVSNSEASTYDGTVPRTPQARWRTLVSALLAAEVEINGKFRMHRVATAQIAEILATIGAGFRDSGLPLHAAYAFHSTADQYRALHDTRGEHVCLLEETRARHAARRPGIRRAAEFWADQLSGYGHLPYRMVKLVAFQLVVFSALLWLAAPKKIGLVRAIEEVLVNYLNPTGPEPAMRGLGNALLIADSYVGYFSLAVFFALLVRRR